LRGVVRTGAFSRPEKLVVGRTTNLSESTVRPSAFTRARISVERKLSSCAQAEDAACTVSTPPRSRPGSVRLAIRSPTARRQRSRSSTIPLACALASRASSSRTPIGAGDRLPGFSPEKREVAIRSRTAEPRAHGDARRFLRDD
jgi:hypothetical protein